MVDNDGDAVEDVTFQFRFRTDVRNPNTFLYNTGTITSLDSPNVERAAVLFGDAVQEGRRRRGQSTVIGDRTCRRRR